MLFLGSGYALEDGRIGVLYVGCIARSHPFWEMRMDPLFSLGFVQATLRDWAAWGMIQAAAREPQVYRMIRMYMPRTYNELVSKYDIIVLSNANRNAVGPKYIEMLAKAVREDKKGLFMAGGWESFGGAFARPDWGETAIGQLLPTEDVIDTWIEYPRGGLRLVIDKWDHEFIKSIPWRRERAPFMNNLHHNLVKVKEGAEELAHVEGGGHPHDPAMVEWEYRGAKVFAFTGETCTMYFGTPWSYYLDFGANLMIYLDRRPVPQDVDLVHEVRFEMFSIKQRKSLLLSLLDFCDAFGANTNTLMAQIDEADAIIARALPKYLHLDFAAMLEACNQAEKRFKDIEREAVALKDKALFWTYLIEWMAVTGTALFCGFVLWTVMIRRKLYRAVSSTYLRQI